jgi:eukaryotic-like serine/threonine-protein kinase
MAGSTRGDDRKVEETLTRDPSYEETVEATTGSLDEPDSSSDIATPAARDDAGRGLVESAQRDRPALVPVDPERYVRGHEIARGGMGRIIAARDRRLGRTVAVKELMQDSPERAGRGTRSDLEARLDREARFEREALITARLQHPAIVSLLETGRWPSGQPFYTMKLVAGRSLSQVASEARPLPERLALLPNLIAMVEAVAHAHRQRIIHRDLKPSNVLIGDLGETVVIDWGLAKELPARPVDDGSPTRAVTGSADSDAAGRRDKGEGAVNAVDGAIDSDVDTVRPGFSTGSLTVAGSVMGTPGYMPPEQAAGLDVDERADVYALGAILYHLLGGAAPYQGKNAQSVLEAVSAGPPRPLAHLEPRLAQDLVTIIEKAMARQREARYRTAFELAQDLRRFQTGQLVAAHRYSRRQLIWRFLLRHRAAAVAGLVALIAVVAIGLVSFRRVLAERDRAEAASAAAAQRADQLAVAQAGSLLETDPRAAVDLLSRLSPRSSPAIWRRARMVASDARLRGIPVQLRGRDGPLERFRLSQDGRMLVTGDGYDLWLWDLASGRHRRIGREEMTVEVRLSPDARLLATADDAIVRVWPLDGGAARELGRHDAAVTALHFLPDGKRLVSSAGDGEVRLWRVAGEGGELVGRHHGLVVAVDFSEDGNTIASLGEDGAVRVWRPGQPEPLADLRAASGRLTALALSGDGSRVAAVGTGRQVWLWDVATGKGRALAGHDREVLDVDFSPDGRQLASAGADHTIRLWDVATGESQVLREHAGAVDAVFYPTGTELLFSHGLDGTVRVWMPDGRTASAVQVLREPGRVAYDVSRDGTTVAVGAGGMLQVWQVAAARASLRGHRGPVSSVEFGPGQAVLSAGGDWTVRLWPAGASAGEPRVMRGHRAALASLAVSPDRRLAASVDEDLYVWLWDLATGSGRQLPGRAARDPRFSPDGALLAAPAEDHLVRIWSTATGESRILRGHTSWVIAVAISPDGRTLASASADQSVRLWDLVTGQSRRLDGHQNAVLRVEFASAGKLIASDLGGSVREWDVTSGTGREIGRHPSGVVALAASAGGDLVAWADGEGIAHLWSRRSGRSRALPPRNHTVEQLLFAPDDRTLFGRDTTDGIYAWDTASDAFLLLPTHGRTIADLAVSADGAAIATAESDRSVRLWPVDLPHEPDPLRAWLAKAAALRGPGPHSTQ